MHFRCYRMRTVCEECGSTCVLDQPSWFVHCAACGADQTIPSDFLHDLFQFKYGFRDRALRPRLEAGELFDALLIGAQGQFFAKHGFRQPSCPTCDLPTDLSRMPLGASVQLPCARCGTVMTTRPADEWLCSIAPRAVQVFAAVNADVIASQRPISLGCPECGGKLKVGPTDRRVVTCTFCDTDVFLPEEVWRTFHPVRRRPTWYVAFNAAREA